LGPFGLVIRGALAEERGVDEISWSESVGCVL
jgi:hypothetical protein